MDLKSIRPFTQVRIKFGIYSRKLNTNNYIFHKKTSGKVLGTLYFFTKKKMTCNYTRCLATYKKVNLNLVAENCQT